VKLFCYLVYWSVGRSVGRSVSAAAHTRPILSPITHYQHSVTNHTLSALLCSGEMSYFQDVAYWNTHKPVECGRPVEAGMNVSDSASQQNTWTEEWSVCSQFRCIW